MPWFCLILFSASFSATILATPWVISLARRLGAVDAPDGFRKTHHGATPRMGGIGVAFGFIAALALFGVLAPDMWSELLSDLPLTAPAILAIAIVLGIGLIDDRRGLSPMTKLGWQAVAACLLFWAGFRIERLFLFGYTIDFGIFALPATCFWFLGCMNIWNLIDGMDGLASGVGTIVSITLVLAASTLGHFGVAYGAAALAGALAGFLVYNFHPARIFLGDTGSLFIGMLLGMLAIRGSLKSGVTVAILTPILVMGLPIVDTLLAIVRRWVRHLPWNAADHGHLHHRLMAFGLSQRQASLFLYSFTVLLCASALASVALQSELLPLFGAILGTVGLTYVFAACREERAGFFEDFRRRLQHRRLEQRTARIVWEGIQRLPNCQNLEAVLHTVVTVAEKLHCEGFGLTYERDGRLLIHRWKDFPTANKESNVDRQRIQLRFVVPDSRRHANESADAALVLEFHQQDNDQVPLSIGSRFLYRFNECLRDQLARHFQDSRDAVLTSAWDDATIGVSRPSAVLAARSAA